MLISRVGTACNPAYTPVRVDRTVGSMLGNPYVLRWGAQGEQRDAVCNAYEDLFCESIAFGIDGVLPAARVAEIGARYGYTDAPRPWNSGAAARAFYRLRERVRGGERIALMCHCAPRRCHAESLASRMPK